MGAGEAVVVLTLIITFWSIFSLIMTFVWPICFFTDLYLRNSQRHKRRMQRGKFYLWELRTFGFPFMFLWDFPILCAFLGMVLALHSNSPAHVWWAYVGITCAIDWITGSEDPPYRRWLASLSEAVKKLKIEPPPRPVIDRA